MKGKKVYVKTLLLMM